MSVLVDLGVCITAVTKGTVEVMLCNFRGWVMRYHVVSTLFVGTAVLGGLRSCVESPCTGALVSSQLSPRRAGITSTTS